MFLYLIIIVSCLAASVYPHGFQVGVTRIESYRTKLIRTGKWEAHQALKSRIWKNAGLKHASGSQPLADYDDVEYITNISIGTPPQHFRVLIDLRTSEFWVPDKTCPTEPCKSICKHASFCKVFCEQHCCNATQALRPLPPKLSKMSGDGCGFRSRFDSDRSTTYHSNGTKFDDGFGFTAQGQGFIGIDWVTLGGRDGLVIPSQTFGQATSGNFPRDDAFDGVLGIATSGFGFGVDGMVPLLQNAKQRRIVKHNMFTIALQREGDSSSNLPGGTITYGDLDTKNCGPIKAYIPSVDTRPTYVNLDAVSFGGFEAAAQLGAQWIATVDLSSTALTAPRRIADGMAKVAGATKDKHGVYSVNCNATIPSLFLTFAGVKFEIPPVELIKPPDDTDSKCVFNVEGDDFYPTFNIGAGLARNNCLVVDLENKRLGMAANLYAS